MRPLFFLLVVCLALTLTTGLTEQRLRRQARSTNLEHLKKDKATIDKSLPHSFDEWKDGKTITAMVKELETPKVVFDWMKKTAEDTAAKLKVLFNKTQVALSNHAATNS